MQIFKSRFTPNATGDEVPLNIGEIVDYETQDGKTIKVTIDSERMSHKDCPNLGYEAIFSDDTQKYFIDGKKIIWWEGKNQWNKK